MLTMISSNPTDNILFKIRPEEVDFKLVRTALEYDRLQILSMLMDHQRLDDREMLKLLANSKGKVVTSKILTELLIF
jgi:hypothetical protein